MRYLFLFVFLCGCAGAPKATPHFIDTDIGRCREYRVKDTQTYEIEFVKSWPISHCNGFLAIPQDEAALWKSYLLNNRSGN